MNTSSPYCECNSSELDHLPPPLFRLVCHCKTCRSFYGTPFNDECNFLLKDCSSIRLDNIELKGHQQGNSPIKRGKCKSCGKISHSTVKFGPFAEFLIIPTERIKNMPLPEPFAHIYYNSRVRDVESNVKKVGGHLLSQLYILARVLKSLFFR